MMKSSVANFTFAFALQRDVVDGSRRTLRSSKQQQPSTAVSTTSPSPSPYVSQSPPLPPSSSPRRDTASINALSLSFVATAILISLFLLMAIFERFLRPSPSPPPPPPPSSHPGSGKASSSPCCDYGPGISVLMPGHDFPTFIAKPAPLPSVTVSISSPPSLLTVYNSCSFQNPDGSCVSAPCKHISEQSLPNVHSLDDIHSLHNHPSTSRNPALNNVTGATETGIS